MEVLVGEGQRRRRREPHIRPAPQELDHGLKGVERETIVAVVRHMSHEYVDLEEILRLSFVLKTGRKFG